MTDEKFNHRLTQMNYRLFSFPFFIGMHLWLGLSPLHAQAATPELKGIRDIVRQSYWANNQNWLLPSIIAAILLIAYITYRLCKRTPTPPLTAYERAQKRLKEALEYIEHLDDKKFSSRISNTLRQYIEARFGLRAPEQTTEEFLNAARSDENISENALHTLEEFLKHCDLAKFAQFTLGKDKKNQLWQTADQFIKEAEERIITDDGKSRIS